MNKHIAKRPRDIAHCINSYLQAGDLAGITSLFHPECLIFFPQGQPPHTGLTGAYTAFQPFIDLQPEIKSTILSEVIINDIALLRADWRVVAPSGEVLAAGQSTEVAKKLNHGGWGYLIDCPYGPPYCQ